MEHLDVENLPVHRNRSGIFRNKSINQFAPCLEDLLFIEPIFEPEAFQGLFNGAPHVLLELGNVLRRPVSAQLREGTLSVGSAGAGSESHRLSEYCGPRHRATKKRRPSPETPFF
jgi:hypothetical protein